MDGDILRYRGSERPTIFVENAQKTEALIKRCSLISFKAYWYLIAFFVFCYWLVTQIENKLPRPLLSKDEYTNEGQFIAENAMRHIHNLTRIGPRPVGSFENEVMAVTLITRELDSIINKASKIHKISIDHQKASGAFSLLFLDGMTNVYRNVQNIILKIGPDVDPTYSVLLNCHFDSVADSPGGSDNSAGCAVLLEVLRVISLSQVPLKNNILFLFNGAEENMMEGSHGFITQHKWAKNIKAFVNIEACGAGGRELLFQAGPENPWLLEAYASAVPYPLASTLAQEIFETGVIPGDTDFRIFRDYGGIPGLDFAWAANGYVYHTKLDTTRYIPSGSIQRTGANILALTLKLANLNYPHENPRRGNLVFFDILGVFVFRTTEGFAVLINVAVILFSFCTLWICLVQGSFYSGTSRSVYLKHLVITCFSILFSWILTILFSLVYSYIISLLNRTMSWYSRPIWALFLYGIPALWVPCVVTYYLNKIQKSIFLSRWTLLRLQLEGNQLVWTVALVLSSLVGFRSSIFISLRLLFLSLAHFLSQKLHFGDKNVEDGVWLYAYLGVMSIPHIMSAYIANGSFLVVIPIMGRVGSGNNAETVFSLISSIIMITLSNFMVPIIVVVRESEKVLKVMLGLLLAAFTVLILTPLGFPYSGDINNPAPQRFVIMHVEQVFHDFSGSVASRRGGMWIVDMDVNSPGSVANLVPELGRAREVNSCEKQLYCGLPYLIPVLSILWKTHWLPAQQPYISVNTTLSLRYKEPRSEDVIRFFFQAHGPDHLSLVISPRSGVELLQWSFLAEKPLSGPDWNGRKTYFVYYSCASDPIPWDFWIDLKVARPSNGSSPLVDVALTGHFLHGGQQRSVKLSKLLSKFPPWTATTGWVSTYKSYLF